MRAKTPLRSPLWGKKRPAWPIALLKPNHSQVSAPDTAVSLGERWENRDRGKKKSAVSRKSRKILQTIKRHLLNVSNSEGLFVAVGCTRIPGEGERARDRPIEGLFIEVKNGCICGDACNYFTS